jgi:5-methylthioribose kinase
MPSDIVKILADIGHDTDDVTVRSLPGGVSSETAVVDTAGTLVVVKRALGRLKVADEWTSDPDRILAEAAGLEWFHQLTPDTVPQPLGVSAKHFGLVLPHAPSPCPDLRRILLDDPHHAPPGIGTALGALAHTWHSASPNAAIGTSLDDRIRLNELRLDPFYRDMATRWQEYRVVIEGLVDELESSALCVVHGDFTPKNVLCLPDNNIWVIDTEVAHIGHPVIDTASMLAHLTLKTLHWVDTPAWAVVNQIRLDFLERISQHDTSTPASLGHHTGLIMAVRVAGRAQVPYLSAQAHERAEATARALLEGASLEDVELT